MRMRSSASGSRSRSGRSQSRQLFWRWSCKARYSAQSSSHPRCSSRKAGKRLRPLAAEAELAAGEVAERAREGRALHVAVLGEVDAVGAPRRLDLALLLVRQLTAQVLDRVQVEIDGL